MGQKVENVDLSLHFQGSQVVDWHVHLHNGDCSYDSDSPTMGSWSSAKSNSGNMNSFSAAMASIAGTWWNGIPTNHVNSDGAPLNYREALRVAVAAA